MAELLCDMDYIRAEYERAAVSGSASTPYFRISLRKDGSDTCTVEIDVNDGPHFVAEMEVLAALIRARTLKAQINRA
ncbi:MAG: hypothetical protein DCF16_11630 [Alphaproteobacteria bacterium]|nr:MAG: hypothetical protein DCF16_11630 [Alphaproteobacteria bacterium]